ncbi:transcriptional regulator, TraR/DksA family [Natronincola peptidivorans]|uniref:Transcriptional regulator, TraR/DksA family n=1 Tax=Natronincola peptidivorans TaxID=426128 RepID=A0A1H9YAA5_9FIRM|nr:TraR/DksA C4-type zinc finger protein [Natronincola peptidivorans]SES65758.1 transcriptional regulator, TraR/DksA family [Natronincola peptidivorans]
MDTKKQNYFQRLLLQEKQDILDTLKRMEEHQPHNASMREATEELSAYDNHPADLGTEMFMAAMQSNLENNEKYRLNQIDEALEKIEIGSYGICQGCGDEIAVERLEIVPETNTCIECEKGEIALYDSKANRPVEESLLQPPFGRTDKDDDDYTGFDGEDAYQEVAKFNEVASDPSFSTADNQGIFDEDSPGIVEGTDKITEEHYENQLPTTKEERRKK